VWRVTAASPEETKVQVLRSSNTLAATNAEECVLTLVLQPTSEPTRDTGELSLTFEFLRTSATFTTVTTANAEFYLFGVTIEPNNVDLISD